MNQTKMKILIYSIPILPFPTCIIGRLSDIE